MMVSVLYGEGETITTESVPIAYVPYAKYADNAGQSNQSINSDYSIHADTAEFAYEYIGYQPGDWYDHDNNGIPESVVIAVWKDETDTKIRIINAETIGSVTNNTGDVQYISNIVQDDSFVFPDGEGWELSTMRDLRITDMSFGALESLGSVFSLPDVSSVYCLSNGYTDAGLTSIQLGDQSTIPDGSQVIAFYYATVTLD